MYALLKFLFSRLDYFQRYGSILYPVILVPILRRGFLYVETVQTLFFCDTDINILLGYESV